MRGSFGRDRRDNVKQRFWDPGKDLILSDQMTSADEASSEWRAKHQAGQVLFFHFAILHNFPLNKNVVFLSVI